MFCESGKIVDVYSLEYKCKMGLFIINSIQNRKASIENLNYI